MNRILLTLFAALVLGASSVGAADRAAGEAKVKQVCQACHGLDGNSQLPDNPKLGGQRQDYIAKALRDYKSGARKNPIMSALVGTLSASDIENLAAYYAAQPAVLMVKH